MACSQLPQYNFNFLYKLLQFILPDFFQLMLQQISSRCKDSLTIAAQILYFLAEMRSVLELSLILRHRSTFKELKD